MNQPAAILELDGVLLDPWPGIMDSLQRTMAELGGDLPSPLLWQTGGILDWLGRLPADLSTLALDRFAEHYTRSGIGVVRAVPGIHRALDRLLRDNVRIHGVSHRSRETVDTLLEELDLDSRIDAVHTDRTNSRSTIWTQAIEAVRVQSAGPCVLVADSRIPEERAREWNVGVVVCAYGRSSWRYLRSLGAPHVLADPCQLPALLKLSAAGIRAGDQAPHDKTVYCLEETFDWIPAVP